MFNLEQAALAHGATKEDWKAFVAYAGGFYGNMSNYYHFGQSKFVPELSPEAFKKILTSNPLYQDQSACYKEVVDQILPLVEKEIFAFEPPYTQINYPSEGGITAYFSRNMTKEDLALVLEFADSKNLNLLNTRAFKENGKIVITVGSIDTEKTQKGIEFKG